MAGMTQNSIAIKVIKYKCCGMRVDIFLHVVFPKVIPSKNLIKLKNEALQDYCPLGNGIFPGAKYLFFCGVSLKGILGKPW